MSSNGGRGNHGSERDPLISPRTTGKYYFLNKQDDSYVGGSTTSVRDGDGGSVVEVAPQGTTPDEFAPRLVQHKVRVFGTTQYIPVFLCIPPLNRSRC